ncbi:site-2 protease family protein [Patescibacteria group bacterium]|nr:site-2 protease family protein [Patescibacteria group bacterium]
MTVLLSVLAFFFLLTVLILIHEWGHFIAARKSGVTVEEFGFGFPPRAKTLFKQGGTIFTLNWIPFGGFVRLKGENAANENERKAHGSFGSVPIYKRVIILVGGVFMNFVLAITLLTIGFSVGQWIPTFFTLEQMELAAEEGIINLELGVLIQDVTSGGSAARVGVPPHSVLVSVDGQDVSVPTDVPALQEGKLRVVYAVRTGPDLSEEAKYTVPLEEGKAGVELVPFPLELSAPRHGVVLALQLAFRETWAMSWQTVKGIGHLFKTLAFTGRVPEGIAGIVGIAQLTYSSVQEGFMTYLRLVALLSLSLAVLNILPFPALDGGRLVFVVAELISNRPINRRFELMTNALGFLFLISLLLLITFYDVVRLFS